MTNPLMPYIAIARPANVAMTGIAVALGFWLARSALPLPALALLMIAGMAATAFGNALNDLRDVATDRISHPNRPLPTGALTVGAAWAFTLFCALVALLSALFVSGVHLIAALLPLLLLTIYSLFLKGTPLAGNITISLLVAYALLFGGLDAPQFPRLIIPAALAFLLNLVREIIKDLQDEPGDRAAGITTTANLPGAIIRTIIFITGFAYLALLFMPTLTSQFGMIYALVCALAVVPIHAWWMAMIARETWRSDVTRLSGLIKLEMFAGLAALAIDHLCA
jgi:geranylgeranylglycerol-phosphate geranylgeranyltransferase